MIQEVSRGQVFDELAHFSQCYHQGFDQLTLRCTEKKLHKNSARFCTNSWSLELLFSYVSFKLTDRGIILETVVITSVNIVTNLSLYCSGGPIGRPPISVRHLRDMLRNSGVSKNLLRNVSIMGVSKMKPSGIQPRNRSRVSRVALIRLVWFAVFRTSEQSWKIDENSEHIVLLRFLVLAVVIWSAE